MAVQKKSSGGTKKYGRNTAKCKLYRDHNIREWNKLKRILQSSGLIYAQWWAHQYHVETILDKIVKGSNRGRVHQKSTSTTG